MMAFIADILAVQWKLIIMSSLVDGSVEVFRNNDHPHLQTWIN
jgi:hypothetical protein